MQPVYEFDIIDMQYPDIIRKASVLVAMVLFPVLNPLVAQEIATLPSDPAVQSGVLPNGTHWYVVSNPYVKGTADFAVVQMTGSGTIPSIGRETVVALSQEALAGQPRLLSPSVQDYFIRYGSVPGPEGFAQVRENSTIFRFRNVDLKLSGSVLDSTLLVLTGIVGRGTCSDDRVLSEWYAPSDQAIIVAGDVDAREVSEKLKMISYMVPSAGSRPRSGYRWVEQDHVEADITDMGVEGLAQATLSWRLQRTPKDMMNTVMPAIYTKYMNMAGIIARERIMEDLRKEDIPVASVESGYVGGVGTLGDEEFFVSVKTSPEHVLSAMTHISKAVSSLDSHGADIREIKSASASFDDALREEDRGGDVGNAEYIDRCIYSFVYNAPLASQKEVRRFHASHVLSDSTECALFHSIISSSVSGTSNLSIKVSSDHEGISPDSLKSLFSSSWRQPQMRRDTVVPRPYLLDGGEKIRVKSLRKEHLSGGHIMTLSNGIRIIYRNMPVEDKMLHYSLSLSGGAGNVEGLCSDDGGYLSDYFSLCRIGGVSGADFRDAIRQQGMTLDCRVGHSATEFRGIVPEDRLDYLFRVLLTVMNSREADHDLWEYYRRGENLRQLADCASGHAGCLTERLAARAETFFKTLSGKVNDGIIVLVGNIDEKKLKEMACTYAGGFKTSDRVFARTTTYDSGLEGISGNRRKGVAGSLEFQISAPLPLTADNFYASAMASMVLERNLSIASAGKGMRVEVSHECRRHPQEVLVVNVSMDEASVEGFASGTDGYSKEAAFDAVRAVLSDLSDMHVDETELESYRYRLDRHLLLVQERPGYWIDAISMRYMEGKDFTSGAQEKIKALAAGNVEKILSALDGGTKTEYTITER